ncbi:MAG: hypothetical protein IJ300_12915 [Clostridia bacterium]|nr:hypothetical protein [Clostridia bacterium]
MKNYISLNGKKIKLTDEQVEEITKSVGTEQIKLADIPAGDTFKIGQDEFIVLEQSNDTTAVIFKNLKYNSEVFGENNNYENSNVDELCKQLAECSGIDGLVEHTVDLTSDDGLKDYGKIRRTMSLLTAEMYRKYVHILDKHKVDSWWWLATAYSTPSHDNSSWVKCVSPSGGICDDDYDGDSGVRPFCILKSNIFVSK